MKNLKTVYNQEITRISQHIIRAYKPKKILLYGSCAGGNPAKNSDIDMLIIKQTSLPRYKRTQQIYRLLRNVKYNVPFEALVYTPQEIKIRLKMGDFFIADIMNKGHLIYG